MDKRAWLRHLGWGLLLVNMFILVPVPSILPLRILCSVISFALLTVARRSRDLFWFLAWGIFALTLGITYFVTSRTVMLFGLVLDIFAFVFLRLAGKKEKAMAEAAGDTYEDRFDWL